MAGDSVKSRSTNIRAWKCGGETDPGEEAGGTVATLPPHVIR